MSEKLIPYYFEGECLGEFTAEYIAFLEASRKMTESEEDRKASEPLKKNEVVRFKEQWAMTIAILTGNTDQLAEVLREKPRVLGIRGKAKGDDGTDT